MKTGTELWSYDSSLQANQRDWVGYRVHATDGNIGRIDEMSTDVGRGSVVVDTGPWIFGKKRLIPASAIRSVDHQDQRVNLTLSKDQIKSAPDCESSRLTDRSYYDEHGTYYGTFL